MSSLQAASEIEPVCKTDEVLSVMGIKHRSTLWRRIRAGKFPPPLDLGGRDNCWPRRTVRQIANGEVSAT